MEDQREAQELDSATEEVVAGGSASTLEAASGAGEQDQVADSEAG